MASKFMKAVQYAKYGGGAAALQHVEVPIPSPKKDEVLIKMEASSINPVDWKIQKGAGRPFFPRKFPFIPCLDLAGEVVKLGPDVTSFKVGDKVFGCPNFLTAGGLAEYAITSQTLIANRPQNISPVEAAGLPVAAGTALQALQFAGIKFDGTENNSNVLITAASGGVGIFAVQLAKLAGVHVTATCGARNLKFVKDLGADEVLDYKTKEGESLKSPSGKKYDCVLHCASAISWSVFEPNLSENGLVIDVTDPSLFKKVFALYKKVTNSKKRFVTLFLDGKKENLEFLADLVEEGKLKCVVDSKHPLSKAEEAWAKSMEGHATGKIIVEM
ncbi:hypothetical protein LUZ60_015710 [Juncus effusus]|nr:hypothetical protein LUZ60_015710 [Juncus effusus]